MPSSRWKRECRSVGVSQRDFVRAARLAWARDRSFRRDPAFSSALYNHIQGCVAEIAAAEDLGLEVDEEVYERGDRGWDFERGGLTIDVKSTSTEPALYVEEGCATADVYLCVYVEAETATFLGSAWAGEVRDAVSHGGLHQIGWEDLGDWPSGRER